MQTLEGIHFGEDNGILLGISPIPNEMENMKWGCWRDDRKQSYPKKRSEMLRTSLKPQIPTPKMLKFVAQLYHK